MIEDEERNYELREEITDCTEESLVFWLPKFVAEVHKVNGQPYPPNSLYQICCGLHQSLRGVNRPEVDIFNSYKFLRFRETLDSCMKELKSTGGFCVRKAQPISKNVEDLLRNQGLLGANSPQSLLDSLVFYTGYYFALRSGMEHRRLRYYPSQLQLFEPAGERAYLRYTEDVSKTNQGGLKHGKKEPKVVVQYENTHDSRRCIVRLYKEYNMKCPPSRPDGAFNLKPLAKPDDKGYWFSSQAVGHNTLSITVKRLCQAAQIEGPFTNHSLRATAATRLFEANVNEKLIMQQTGHSTTSGVRSYEHVGEKLKTVTSDVLNHVESTEVKECYQKAIISEVGPVTSKENCTPVFQLQGASSFTINFNFSK